MMVCQSFVLDNGAFSNWRVGRPTDWPAYYRWVGEVLYHPAFDWAVIPDVIDGTEDQNDQLLAEWPHSKFIGVPVYHLHESLDRLARLCAEWPRVALGSSGQYKTPGSKPWRYRMNEMREVVCDSMGRPKGGVKLHLLRGLNPNYFTKLPAASADSVTVRINIGMDCPWPEIYAVSSKAIRGVAYATRIETFQSSPVWELFELDKPLKSALRMLSKRPPGGGLWEIDIERDAA